MSRFSTCLRRRRQQSSKQVQMIDAFLASLWVSAPALLEAASRALAWI